MIQKISGFKNKYKLTESSNTRDIAELRTSYEKFRCIICNEKTAERFKPKSYVTINKSVEDDVFYVNGIF